MKGEIITMEVYGPNNYLLTNEDVYEIELYDPTMKQTDYNKETAYLYGDFYYLYRGEFTQYELDRMPGMKPGIYWNTTTNEPLMVSPTQIEEDEYTFSDKIGSTDAEKVIDNINQRNIILLDLPENKKSGGDMLIMPNDDILKRLLKKAFNMKGVTIDQCQNGFPNRNAKTNFKAALSKDTPLSFNYFNRGVDALGLKFTIILEDNNDYSIGIRLESPLTASSEDTYDL